jgi:hypothetical protein
MQPARVELAPGPIAARLDVDAVDERGDRFADLEPSS